MTARLVRDALAFLGVSIVVLLGAYWGSALVYAVVTGR